VPSDQVIIGDRLIGPSSSDEIVSISTKLADSSDLTQIYTLSGTFLAYDSET